MLHSSIGGHIKVSQCVKFEHYLRLGLICRLKAFPDMVNPSKMAAIVDKIQNGLHNVQLMPVVMIWSTKKCHE